MEPLRRTPGSLNQLLQDLRRALAQLLELVLELLLWQLSTLLKIAPAVASVGGEGSMCRMVFYHNKAAAGAVPDVAQIFDTNNFYSGRNVNYATKFSLLDDITHQMVITSYNSSSGVAFSAGPALFKIIRVTPRTVVQFGGNAGTISDLPLDDFRSPTVVTMSLVAS